MFLFSPEDFSQRLHLLVEEELLGAVDEVGRVEAAVHTPIVDIEILASSA